MTVKKKPRRKAVKLKPPDGNPLDTILGIFKVTIRAYRGHIRAIKAKTKAASDPVVIWFEPEERHGELSQLFTPNSFFMEAMGEIAAALHTAEEGVVHITTDGKFCVCLSVPGEVYLERNKLLALERRLPRIAAELEVILHRPPGELID